MTVAMLPGGLGTRLCEETTGDEPFMLAYPDGVSDIDLPRLLEYHRAQGRLVTLTAVRPTARFLVGKRRLQSRRPLLAFAFLTTVIRLINTAAGMGGIRIIPRGLTIGQFLICLTGPFQCHPLDARAGGCLPVCCSYSVGVHGVFARG